VSRQSGMLIASTFSLGEKSPSRPLTESVHAKPCFRQVTFRGDRLPAGAHTFVNTGRLPNTDPGPCTPPTFHIAGPRRHKSDMPTIRSSGFPPRNAPNSIRRLWGVSRSQSARISQKLTCGKIGRSSGHGMLVSRISSIAYSLYSRPRAPSFHYHGRRHGEINDCNRLHFQRTHRAH